MNTPHNYKQGTQEENSLKILLLQELLLKVQYETEEHGTLQTVDEFPIWNMEIHWKFVDRLKTFSALLQTTEDRLANLRIN